MALAGCGGDGGGTRDSTAPASRAVVTTAAADGGEPQPVLAVQLGAFSDPANAGRQRDSLAAAGWSAYVHAGDSKDVPMYRVRIAPSRDSILPRLIAGALAGGGREAVVVRDDVRASMIGGARLIEVNRGSHGMSAIVRWALSSDRGAILVVEDPTAVEAEPVPDGFVFATEEGAIVVQHDGVWDVAPAPDWRKIAVGIAWVIQGRERPQVPAAEWAALARRTGLSADSARRGAFVASGMSTAFGLAQPAVYDLAVSADSGERKPLVLPMAGGWRVGWSSAGEAVLVGTNPKRAGDDEPSPSFLAIDLRGRPIGSDATSPAPVAWTTGPTLDISVPVDFTARHTIAAGARTIESGGGWIRVRERVAGRDASRIVGPGTALAATATGRYIVALVPNQRAKTYDHPARVMVYDLGG